jgi:hypothetical protein
VPALTVRRPWLIAAVLAGLILAVLLGGRAAWRLSHRFAGPPPPPRHTDVAQIADWMSVPYISRAYRVPEPELFRALGVEPQGPRVRRLRDIASASGRTSDEVVQIVRDTVSAWQAEHSRPPSPPGARPAPGAGAPGAGPAAGATMPGTGLMMGATMPEPSLPLAVTTPMTAAAS